MGTSILEAKLLQNLIIMRDKLIHSILLDLCKTYANLERDRCMDMLEGYGVGPIMLRIMQTYWAGYIWRRRQGSITGPYSRATAG